MKTISTVLLLFFLALPAFGQPMNSLPSAPTLPTNYIFVVENPSIKTWKSTINTLINTMRSNLVASGVGTNVSFTTNLFITGSNTVAAGANVTVTTNITASNVTFTVSTIPGGVSSTNANQFGASTNLTIKDGALLTNAIAHGLSIPGTNRIVFSNGTAFAMSPTNDVIYFFNTNLTDIPSLVWWNGTAGAGFRSGGGTILELISTYSNTVTMGVLRARNIILTNGATTGYVWTGTDNNGAGAWQAPTGGSDVTISNANILWVDKSGTNGLRGSFERAFPHPNHAWSNAVAGDTVVVMPGTYHGCSNLMKAGVNWQGIGWPMLTYTNRTNDRGTGIFDERFSGATTSVIDGFNFIYSTGLPTTNAAGEVCCTPTNISFAGVLSITNPLTMVDFRFGDIDFVCLPEVGGSQCINVQDTKLTRVRGRSMRDLFYTSNYVAGIDEFGGPAYWPSSAEGIFWEQGNLHVEIDSVLMTKFSVYGQCPVRGLDRTNNLFVKLGSSVGSVFLNTLCTNPPNWNTFIAVNSMNGSSNQGTLGVLTGVAFNILGGGTHELNAGKIVNGFHRVPPVTIHGAGHSTPRVKINARKVAFELGIKDNDPEALMCSIAGGIVDLNVIEWEDTGGATAGLNLTGGSTTVSGGRLTVTNGTGVRLGIGATARLNNMAIDTSTTSAMTNTPVFVSTNGLILNNCVLVAPTAAPVIMATSAKSVLVYGVLTSNKTNSPNVTTQVGSQIVDANVR